MTTHPNETPEPLAGATVESCISALVSALQRDKGWLHDYADSVVRDAIERKHLEPLAQGQAGEKAIRELCVGRIEWRCCTDDGAYCMSFDRDNSLSPEREATEWLERHQRDYPHRFMAYKVRRVVVQSQLQGEALAMLSRLSDATAALQAKDAEIARLKAALQQAKSDMRGVIENSLCATDPDRPFSEVRQEVKQHPLLKAIDDVLTGGRNA